MEQRRDCHAHRVAAAVAAMIMAAMAPFAAGIEDADCALETTIRWSGTSERLYLENGGCTNLSAIVEERSDKYGAKGPLYHFHRDNNTIADSWTGDFFLDSSLYIEDNVQLDIIGIQYGGDVKRLLLRSDSEKYINVRAHGGRLMLKGVKVRSFDRSANDGLGGADKVVEDGRSYISAISEIIVDPSETCDGRPKDTMGESRLDIIDSKISQLGFYDAESYGVSYKVRGLCSDLSNLDIMDQVGVYGDILGSELAYNYFGHYSFGHQGGNWSNNKVHHNVGYGFDPHDDSDYLTIHNNEVYKNGNHGIIASKRCDHLSIQGNLVYWNENNGIMLHRSSDYAVVAHNIVHDNADAGLAMYESSYNEVHDNYFIGNTYGVRWSMGASYNNVYDNTMDVTSADTPQYAVYMYRGSDDVDVEGSDGRPKFNEVRNNIMNAPSEVMKVTEADDNSFGDNEWVGEFVRFKDASRNFVRGNLAVSIVSEDADFDVKLSGTVCFDDDSDDDFYPTCEDDEIR